MQKLRAVIIAFLICSAVAGGAYARFWRDRVTVINANAEAAFFESSRRIDRLAAVVTRRESERSRTMLFVGDVMLSRGVDYMTKKAGSGDPRFPFLHVAEKIREADFAFANLEGPISDHGRDQGSIYSFRANPAMAEGLAFAGFDIVSLANNHIWDWGSEALADTIQILKSHGIQAVGAGLGAAEANAPKIVKVGDTTVAFLAYTNLYPRSFAAVADHPGVSLFELERITLAIATVRPSVDIVVVSLHWGEEYQKTHNAFQEKVAHTLIETGADLIIGHHPHVVQEIERYVSRLPAGRQGWIAYSLGNFVFDQGFSPETAEGLILEATIFGRRLTKVRGIPVSINRTFQPTFSKLE